MSLLKRFFIKDKVYFENEPPGGVLPGNENLGGGGIINSPLKDASDIDGRLADLFGRLNQRGITFYPGIIDRFSTPQFYNALPGEIRDNDNTLMTYLENSGRFNDLIPRERFTSDGLFGEYLQLPEYIGSDGTVRRAESGARINVDYLRTVGIDPSKVLFFRLTQPMEEEPKPELYWTSDLSEVIGGLEREVPPAKRRTAIILVSDLQTINGNGGLIQDVNDDSGLAVRQINVEPFDQNRVITKFSAIVN